MLYDVHLLHVGRGHRGRNLSIIYYVTIFMTSELWRNIIQKIAFFAFFSVRKTPIISKIMVVEQKKLYIRDPQYLAFHLIPNSTKSEEKNFHFFSRTKIFIFWWRHNRNNALGYYIKNHIILRQYIWK